MDQRERLVDAAIRCLQRNGYARTTTREIVAEAGVHLPAVNYYFGSKDELLKVAVTQALRRWTASVLSALDDPPAASPHDDLQHAMTVFIGLLPGNRAGVIAGVEAFAQAPRSQDLAAHLAKEYQACREVVAERIAAMARHHAARGTSPIVVDGAGTAVDDMASVLLALFDGLALQWLLASEQLPPPDRVVRALAALGAVAAQAPEAGQG